MNGNVWAQVENKLTTVSGTRVTVACLQGSVSAANEHWIDPKQYLHFSLLYSVALLSNSCLEILKRQPTDVLMHPKLFSDSLNKRIQTPNSSPSWFKKERMKIPSSLLSFEDYIKQVLFKKKRRIYHCVFNSSYYNLSIVLCAKILPCLKIMFFSSFTCDAI